MLDPQSDTWHYVVEQMTQALELDTKELEQLGVDAERTNFLRGRIYLARWTLDKFGATDDEPATQTMTGFLNRKPFTGGFY